jgi:hypothetical protein
MPARLFGILFSQFLIVSSLLAGGWLCSAPAVARSPAVPDVVRAWRAEKAIATLQLLRQFMQLPGMASRPWRLC